jgi:hypothetical protein
LSLSLSCWLSFAAAWQAQTGTANDKKVLLSHVQTLTLNDGQKTSGRRNAPLPQLECRGQNCRKWKPAAVQCFNRGTDGVDVQWECKAEMPAGFSFGQTEVSCEGYDYPDDPYILRGSCQLGYQLRYDAAAANAAAAHSQHQNADRYDTGAGASRFGTKPSAPPAPHTYR